MYNYDLGYMLVKIIYKKKIVCHWANVGKKEKFITIPDVSFLQGVRGSPLENSPSPPFASSAPEDGPLLAAQHGGPDTAHVHVCPAGPLDGLHLVHHRQDGDGGQFLQLGYR